MNARIQRQGPGVSLNNLRMLIRGGYKEETVRRRRRKGVSNQGYLQKSW